MQKQKIVIVLVVQILGIIFLNSCEKATLTKDELSGTMSFSKDIIPIFESNCNQCHFGTRKPVLAVKPFESLKNYVNVEKPAESSLYIKLTTGSSHLDKANSTEQQKILLWITQGAQNN